MAKPDQRLISEYGKMWPRAIFYSKAASPSTGKIRVIAQDLPLLQQPGVYVLYVEEKPYYVGRTDLLWKRLYRWANRKNSPHYNFWTHFSAFAVRDEKLCKELEAALIATIPGMNNGAKPKLVKIPIPLQVRKLMKP